MGKLEVRIIEAKKLPNPQTFGSPSPYVKIACEQNAFKTQAAEKTQEPQWNEEFKFQLADAALAQVKFEIWNKNTMSDDFMGSYTVSVSGLVKGEPLDEWYILQNCKTNGEIRISMTAVDFGQEPGLKEHAGKAKEVAKEGLEAAKGAAKDVIGGVKGLFK